MRLNQVNTLLRTISPTVLPPARGVALVRPEASRSRTSTEVSPIGEDTVGTGASVEATFTGQTSVHGP